MKIIPTLAFNNSNSTHQVGFGSNSYNTYAKWI